MHIVHRVKRVRLLSTRLLVIVLSCCTAMCVNAETSLILNRAIEITPPEHFCQLGDSERERNLTKVQHQKMAPAGELTQFVVPCDELKDYNSGKLQEFSKWAQVLVSRQQGQLELVEVSRRAFIQATAHNFLVEPTDIDEVNRRLRHYLNGNELTLKAAQMQPIGIIGPAFYVALQIVAQSDGRAAPASGIVAMTVVNKLPLVIQVFSTTSASRQEMFETAKAYAESIVSKN